MLRPVHALMLDVLTSYPSGISLNALAALLKGKVARSIVLREVKKLSDMSLVRIVRDERHKQRRIVIPREELTLFSNSLMKLRPSSFEEAVARLPKMLILFKEAKVKSENKHFVDYFKHRMKEELSLALEVI